MSWKWSALCSIAIVAPAWALSAAPASAQVNPASSAPRTATEAAEQIAALQKVEKELRVAEAKQALADAAALEAKATAAREYLTSVGEYVPLAQDDPQPTSVTTTTETADGKKVEVKQTYGQMELAGSKDNKATFGGIEFGIGLAFSLDVGDNDRIISAEKVNDIVRITESGNTRARLLLESHYFLTPKGDFAFGLHNDGKIGPDGKPGKNDWGFGPFIGIQPGSDNVIDAMGGGVMIGLKRPGEGTDSFNFGVGILYDFGVRTLGEGVVKNKPLPAGETEIRYLKQSQVGLMLVSSFSF